MRRPISLLLVSFLVQGVLFPGSISAQTAETAATAVSGQQLLDGTPVRLSLGRAMSSKNAKTGETIDFDVLEDVKVGDLTVIPHGSSAIGTVTNAKAAGRLGKGGKLDIKIDYVRLATGEKITLRAIKGEKGDNRTGTMTTALVASGILFFPAAPLFLFIKGKNINLAKGTEVTAYVDGNFPIDAARFSPDHASADAAVTIRSSPEGADIEVDGRFVGSTPSAIQLRPGEHKLALKKAGFTVWERTITVAAGNAVTIDASLERISNP